MSCQRYRKSRREILPLISFGGITTPVGALISSRTSPFVADGAMSVVDVEIWVGSKIMPRISSVNPGLRSAPLPYQPPPLLWQGCTMGSNENVSRDLKRCRGQFQDQIVIIRK